MPHALDFRPLGAIVGRKQYGEWGAHSHCNLRRICLFELPNRNGHLLRLSGLRACDLSFI